MYKIAITGHRPGKLPGVTYDNFLYADWSVRFMELMEQKILEYCKHYGDIQCISGMALGVDWLFLLAAMSAKNKNPDAKIYTFGAIPCKNQSVKWSSEYKIKYEQLLLSCDEVKFIHDDSYTSTCIQERNKYMVDMCDGLIAIWDGSKSGTGNCVKYAIEQHKLKVIYNPNRL